MLVPDVGPSTEAVREHFHLTCKSGSTEIEGERGRERERYIYIYIYIDSENEEERERERKRERERERTEKKKGGRERLPLNASRWPDGFRRVQEALPSTLYALTLKTPVPAL